MSNVLLTGGLGFIGSHLLDRLLAEGHRVTVIDNLSNNTILAEHVYADVSDHLLWPDLHGTDLIFHLAAVSRTTPAIQDPVRCHEVNATGTLRLLEKAHHECPRARIVVASSNVVYGAWTPYRASKLAAEMYVSVYNELYGMNCIALRFANTYGSRMRWDDLACFASLRRSMVEKGYIEITGDGKQTRDWVHVSDIVEGCMKAANSDVREVMDLCSGREFKMLEVARMFDCPVIPVPDRPGDAKRLPQDPCDAWEKLSWLATIRLEDGIKDVLAEVPSR